MKLYLHKPFGLIFWSSILSIIFSCSSAFCSPGEGVFAIDLKTNEISRLFEYKNPDPNPSSLVGLLKYSFVKNKHGMYNFVYQPNNDGNLYQFTADFRENQILSTEPHLLVPPQFNFFRFCSLLS